MGWKSNEPWHRELGGWFTKEAVPFVTAGARGFAAGGPYMGVVAALTTTNKRGGNPLGKLGKEAEKIVQPVVLITESINGINLATGAAGQRQQQRNDDGPRVVFC